MKRRVLVGLGVLVTLAGIIFTLQGTGVIGGSAMSGVTLWAVAGPVIAVVGLAIAAVGLRRRLAS
jgi:hypothetical protein